MRGKVRVYKEPCNSGSLSFFDENLMCCKYDVGMKDFDSWNEVKKLQEIKDRSACPIFIKEREIWWLSLGLNIGDEEDGKGKFFERPILVIRKFNNKLFWGCALSTKIKDNNRYYITVSTKNGLRSVIISQLRLHDTKRLRDKLDRLNINDFDKVKTAIKGLL